MKYADMAGRCEEARSTSTEGTEMPHKVTQELFGFQVSGPIHRALRLACGCIVVSRTPDGPIEVLYACTHTQEAP